MGFAMNFDLMSIRQIVAVCAMTRLLSRGPPDYSIIGGWSLGAMASSTSAAFLDACGNGVRALFALDCFSHYPWAENSFQL